MSTRWPDKIIVGLTGNIATGKSTVMAMAEERGAMTLDADKLVHEILKNDGRAKEAIYSTFGTEFRLADDTVDRDKLGRLVFGDPDALNQLEKIIHPIVRQNLLKRIDTGEATVVFIEAIKLLEGDLAAECDQIWVTRCSPETQVRRLITFRGMDEVSAIQRVRAQSPQHLKVAAADVVIDTDETLTNVKIYFALAWKKLTQVSRRTQAVGGVDNRRPDQKHPAPGGLDQNSAKFERPTKRNIDSEIKPKRLEYDDVIVRRARPQDIPSILWHMQQATGGTMNMKRAEMLMSLGQRGYLIGQQGITISTVMGWHSVDQIATIDQVFVYPVERAKRTAAAVIQEITATAYELDCDVILAYLAKDSPIEIRQLFEEKGFQDVDPVKLPTKWRPVVDTAKPEGGPVLMHNMLRESDG